MRGCCTRCCSLSFERSVRPESISRPYVDWFTHGASTTRLSLSHSLTEPWAFSWLVAYHSLVFANPSLTTDIVAKLTADGSLDTPLIPASQLALARSITKVATLALAFSLDPPHTLLSCGTLVGPSLRAAPRIVSPRGRHGSFRKAAVPQLEQQQVRARSYLLQPPRVPHLRCWPPRL